MESERGYFLEIQKRMATGNDDPNIVDLEKFKTLTMRMQIVEAAIFYGTEEILKKVLYFAQNFPDGSATALIQVAIRTHNPDIIRHMVDSLRKNFQPWRGDLVTGFLLHYKIISTANGFTPLTSAVKSGNAWVVEYLIQTGHRVNQRDQNDCTPLRTAIREKNKKMMCFLLNNGANSREIETRHQDPLVYEALRHDQEASLIDMLVSSGADVTRPSRSGYYPLHHTPLVNEESRHLFVWRMIAQGASLAEKNWGGETPLMTAINFDQVDTIKIFQLHGLQLEDHWKEAMHHAVKNDAGRVFIYLIKCGYQASEAIIRGVTLGECAYRNGRCTYLMYCLIKKATPYHLPNFRGTGIDHRHRLTKFVWGYLIEAVKARVLDREPRLNNIHRVPFESVKHNEDVLYLMALTVRAQRIMSRAKEGWREVQPEWKELEQLLCDELRQFLRAELDPIMLKTRVADDIFYVGRHLPYLVRKKLFGYRTINISIAEAEVLWESPKEWEKKKGKQRG
ncbi:hypothetical protein QAD02_021502 [Eretmocerus hayati]|uniref:Uncharacterized protein n=1 Tax=Eretmocerus hayati TaxID=131215 RepID=A0ACC2PQX4_9HYME|nr:hypothetical protein QAD02_021502 [Eretmocerus hayati]